MESSTPSQVPKVETYYTDWLQVPASSANESFWKYTEKKGTHGFRLALHELNKVTAPAIPALGPQNLLKRLDDAGDARLSTLWRTLSNAGIPVERSDTVEMAAYKLNVELDKVARAYYDQLLQEQVTEEQALDWFAMNAFEDEVNKARQSILDESRRAVKDLDENEGLLFALFGQLIIAGANNILYIERLDELHAYYGDEIQSRYVTGTITMLQKGINGRIEVQLVGGIPAHRSALTLDKLKAYLREPFGGQYEPITSKHVSLP